MKVRVHLNRLSKMVIFVDNIKVISASLYRIITCVTIAELVLGKKTSKIWPFNYIYNFSIYL